jgi:hypothetical protein
MVKTFERANAEVERLPADDQEQIGRTLRWPKIIHLPDAREARCVSLAFVRCPASRCLLSCRQ